MPTKKKTSNARKPVKKATEAPTVAKASSSTKGSSAAKKAKPAKTVAKPGRAKAGEKAARPVGKVASKKTSGKTKPVSKPISKTGPSRRKVSAAITKEKDLAKPGGRSEVNGRSKRGVVADSARPSSTSRRTPPKAGKSGVNVREAVIEDATVEEVTTTRAYDSGLDSHVAIKAAPELGSAPASEPAAEAVNAPQSAYIESSIDPKRGAHAELRSHSKPQVQLLRQRVQTLRSPERRHTMRGH